jgi:hypothetical protein
VGLVEPLVGGMEFCDHGGKSGHGLDEVHQCRESLLGAVRVPGDGPDQAGGDT